MALDGIRATTDAINRQSYELAVRRLLREPMTWDTFARLRSAREWLDRALDHQRNIGSTLVLGEKMGAFDWVIEPITARAGQWVHDTARDGAPRSMKPYRWHLFTGDLRWRATSTGVGVETLCGLGVWGHSVVSGDEPGEGGACLYCTRRISPA